jgi:Undecaprenyl-phosphate glucose phosphotransferase
MTRRTLNLWRSGLTLVLFFIPAVALSLSGYIRFLSGLFPAADIDLYSYTGWIIVVTCIWALVVEHLNLNRVAALITLHTGVSTAAKATAYSMILVLALDFFYRQMTFSRIFVVASCFLLFVITLLIIHLFRIVTHFFGNSSVGRVRVAIVGVGDDSARVAMRLEHNVFSPCEVVCFVALPGQSPTVTSAPVVGWNQLDEVTETYHCHEVMVALPPQRFGEIQAILESVQRLCVPARVVLDLDRGIFIPERLFEFCGLALLDVRPYPIDTVRYAIGKRIFDTVFSLLILIFAAPLICTIALAIKLTSRGPIYFAQERIGTNGKRFRMLKFRTMCTQDSVTCNSKHTVRDDPRVTAVGRFLRKTSLDELPQFINVLKGDMSVVGPRPELTFFVQKFRKEIPAYMARHNVKCGITGWAQINGFRGSDTSIPERIQYDLYYMQNWSMIFDLKIILLTLFNGLIARHAY